MQDPGESVTTIHIPYPESGGLHLRIAVGACRLKIVPGDESLFVSGTYEDRHTLRHCGSNRTAVT